MEKRKIIMGLLTLAALLMTSIVFISCGDSDEDGSQTKNFTVNVDKLIGKAWSKTVYRNSWERKMYEIEFQSKTSVFVRLTDYSYDIDEKNLKRSDIIFEDYCRFTVKGNVITISFETINGTETLEISFDENNRPKGWIALFDEDAESDGSALEGYYMFNYFWTNNSLIANFLDALAAGDDRSYKNYSENLGSAGVHILNGHYLYVVQLQCISSSSPADMSRNITYNNEILVPVLSRHFVSPYNSSTEYYLNYYLIDQADETLEYSYSGNNITFSWGTYTIGTGDENDLKKAK
jgi:hypothetical protein